MGKVKNKTQYEITLEWLEKFRTSVNILTEKVRSKQIDNEQLAKIEIDALNSQIETFKQGKIIKKPVVKEEEGSWDDQDDWD